MSVSRMKIVRLNTETEPLFWKHVYTDMPDYYFFILDMKYDAANSGVTLALDEKRKIQGMLLVYRDTLAQLRGSNEAIEMLLAELDLGKVMITTPMEYAPFKLPSRYHLREAKGLTLMALRKGEETPQIRHDLVRLFTNDAENIAALMRTCDFDWWAEINSQQIAEGMKQRVWFGIKLDGKLVSIGGARIDDWVGNINTVATCKDYRGRGYATSIVSALVVQIMKKSSLALIHVETKNAPALRAYTKAGFRPYKNYTVAKAEQVEEWRKA